MKKIIIVSILAIALIVPTVALAQLSGALDKLHEVGGTQGEKLGVQADLSSTVATVIKAILAIVGSVFLVLTIYAGVLWMTAQGEDEKVKKAKDIITASVVGLVIVLSAYAITAFVTSKLTQSSPVDDLAPPPSSGPEGCCYFKNFGIITCIEGYTESACGAAPNREWWTEAACDAGCGG